MASSRKNIKDFREFISEEEATALSSKMQSLIRKCTAERGKKTEKYVEEALEALCKEGRIVSFYMTTKWSRADKRGVDVVVYLNDGTEVRCQIKSSIAGVQKHLVQQEKFKEKVGVIYGNYFAGETFEEYKERILSSLSTLGHP